MVLRERDDKGLGLQLVVREFPVWKRIHESNIDLALTERRTLRGRSHFAKCDFDPGILLAELLKELRNDGKPGCTLESDHNLSDFTTSGTLGSELCSLEDAKALFRLPPKYMTRLRQ